MSLFKRGCFILTLMALFTGCGGTTEKSVEESSSSTKPNIIFILADDMGYGDIKALNGAAGVVTPNLDRLVNEGMSFSDAHTNSAVCTPTRYGIVTGRYCWRSRLKSGVLVGHDQSLVEPGRLTVGGLLSQNGYYTGTVGKWHLGLDWAKKDDTKDLFEGDNVWDIKNTDNVDYAAVVKGGPMSCGFDYEYIIPASLDIAPYTYIENQRVTAPVTGKSEAYRSDEARGMWYRHGDIADDFDQNTTLQNITAKAVEFVTDASKRDEPFFLYFPLTAPHTPWFPSEEFKGKSTAGVYGDFVCMVDNTVGQIMRRLDKLGIADNTIIVFTSDNGSHWLPSDIKSFEHQANIGRSGMKSDVWDGGHRVPFVVKWPNVAKPNSRSEEVICTTDFMATVAEMLNVTLPKDAGEDSYSILPVLRGDKLTKSLREATVHHGINGMFAIRRGKWKFIDGKGSGGWSYNGKGETLPGQLYNMEIDPLEKNNLYSAKNEIALELKDLLERYKSNPSSLPAK